MEETDNVVSMTKWNLLCWLCILSSFAGLWALYFLRSRNDADGTTPVSPIEPHLQSPSLLFHKPANPSPKPRVPFVVLQAPDWSVLPKLLREYRQDAQAVLERLSKGMEMALMLETDYPSRATTRNRVSSLIQIRIERLSTLFETQERELEKILKPFATAMMLPSTKDEERVPVSDIPSPLVNNKHSTSIIRSRTGVAFQNATTLHNFSEANNTFFSSENNRQPSTSTTPASYDSALQVMAHLVRDWSNWGAPVRKSLYLWCRQALMEHSDNTTTTKRPQSVLVPGAGLGRLAWELATLDGHWVHALEVSVGMAAAASFVLQSTSQVKLYPYIHDGFSNQVDTEDRYQSVTVPDIDTNVSYSTAEVAKSGSLSYTVAPFEALSELPNLNSTFDAIVTCFFLDVCTDLYQYLEIIHTLLRRGGLWINVGPLQWHANALLPALAANELRLLLEPDYDILHWCVDEEPLEYRNPTTSTQHNRRASTAYNGYCPLRFVARKK